MSESIVRQGDRAQCIHKSLAFGDCDSQDELEEIGEYAFVNCILLERIVITSVVKTIKGMAFYNCTGLTTVTLGDELEEIGESAFGSCASLQRIVMPNVNAFKTIEKETFRGCLGLTTIIARRRRATMRSYSSSSQSAAMPRRHPPPSSSSSSHHTPHDIDDGHRGGIWDGSRTIRRNP